MAEGDWFAGSRILGVAGAAWLLLLPSAPKPDRSRPPSSGAALEEQRCPRYRADNIRECNIRECNIRERNAKSGSPKSAPAGCSDR